MIRHDPGPSPAECLAPTRLIDSDHPDIAAIAAEVTVGARDDVGRAVRLHDFVRDRILFGWAPAFERQKASEVLKSGIGFCNTKSTLFAALLRASQIPARVRFKTINRRILDGLIRPPQPFVDHSYVEAWLDGRWVGTDSYAVDSALQRAAVARCRAEGKRIGYGVHTSGTTIWDGRSNAFTQLNDDGSVPDLTDEDFGSFIDLDSFRATGRSRSPTHLAARLGTRFMLPAANRRAERLRAEP
jgi:transglutaminase-like putative cysteine protease